MRELAYPIRKLNRGYYVLAEYNATSDVVRELERTLKIADEILRFISVAAAATKPNERAGKAPQKPERTPEIDEFDVDGAGLTE